MSENMADVLREECRTLYVEGYDDMFCFRDADELAAALAAAGFGPVADAKAEALEEAAEEFESHVGVGEFAEQSTRGGAHWAHIEEDWEHQGPYMDWLRNRAESLRQS